MHMAQELSVTVSFVVAAPKMVHSNLCLLAFTSFV